MNRRAGRVPGGESDFLSLDPDGAPDSQYGAYEYVGKGSPLTLRAPGEPGRRQVRYHVGESGYRVLASAVVQVVPASAELEVRASGGESIGRVTVVAKEETRLEAGS